MRIAIDGPSGAGKSTIAKRLAAHYDILYLDTGAMYRAAGLAVLRAGENTKDEEAVVRIVNDANIEVKYMDGAQHVFLEGEDVNGLIRTEEVSFAASNVSAFGPVREKMVNLQRETARVSGAVLDGRDICMYVLPDAEHKFFLTADASERARRRYEELIARGEEADYEDILAKVIERDHNDSTRAVSPLQQAPDAVLIDSTNLDIDGVVEKMISIIEANK